MAKTQLKKKRLNFAANGKNSGGPSKRDLVLSSSSIAMSAAVRERKRSMLMDTPPSPQPRRQAGKSSGPPLSKRTALQVRGA